MTATTLQHAYRPFLLDAGEAPVLPDDLDVILRRRWAFQAVTGLTDADVHTDPLVAFPLPIRQQQAWHGNPSFLWCPLAWLPEPLAAPPESTTTVPSVASRVWAATVVLALGATGLFDREHGFADLEQRYGFTLSDPATLQRATAWCADPTRGDDLFDRIRQDIHGAILGAAAPARTAALMGMLRPQQAAIADSLQRSFAAATDPQQALVGHLAVALDMLGDHPFDGPVRVGDVVLGILREIHPDGDAGEVDPVLVHEAAADLQSLLAAVADRTITA